MQRPLLSPRLNAVRGRKPQTHFWLVCIPVQFASAQRPSFQQFVFCFFFDFFHEIEMSRPSLRAFSLPLRMKFTICVKNAALKNEFWLRNGDQRQLSGMPAHSVGPTPSMWLNCNAAGVSSSSIANMASPIAESITLQHFNKINKKINKFSFEYTFACTCVITTAWAPSECGSNKNDRCFTPF